jgi:hypothetical protein
MAYVKSLGKKEGILMADNDAKLFHAPPWLFRCIHERKKAFERTLSHVPHSKLEGPLRGFKATIVIIDDIGLDFGQRVSKGEVCEGALPTT